MDNRLTFVLEEGEGLHIEFKENISKQLDREMVAFANASGGSIFIGVNDDNVITGVNITNGLRSQIQDIARNCDPSVQIEIVTYKEQSVIEIKVNEGYDKPYRCRDGFYIRQSENSQKLKRDEILDLISSSNMLRFDEALNNKFQYPQDFSQERLEEYLSASEIQKLIDIKNILVNLSVAKEVKERLQFTNAAVLFFAKSPQQFFPESYITVVQYKTLDRFSIIDQKELKGTLLQQIDDTISVVLRHINMEIKISDKPGPQLGRRVELYDYPIPAIREAIVNAVAHRDYRYDSSHIYIHMYPDRIEIENPGGLCHGMTPEMLTQRSIRRNRLIADLLHRAHYIEKVGSGFSRIKHSLQTNNNPPYEISATNFFNLKLYKRESTVLPSQLTERQLELLGIIREKGSITTKLTAKLLNISDDTALNDLRALARLNLITKEGKGKSTTYRLVFD